MMFDEDARPAHAPYTLGSLPDVAANALGASGRQPRSGAVPQQLSLDFDLLCASPAVVPVDAAARYAPPTLPDFRLSNDRRLALSWKGRAQANVEAIRTLNVLDREQRPATETEPETVAQFVGFGASELANGMFADRAGEFRPGWRELGESLLAETTDAELRSLRRATQYAHYTPEYIIRAMWDAAQMLGFTGGRILEPGCGSGMFMGLRPEALSADTLFVGIENDPVSARVASALYPNQVIRCIDFDKAALPRDFDLAIGNPPFSSLTIRNKTALGGLGLSLHDYFIAKALDHLRPGGVALFVTSRYTLDKSDTGARRHIDSLADLMAAVRLPAGAMAEDAGTDVVVDILLFQKRFPDALSMSPDWIELDDVPDSDGGAGPLRINRYFLDHPGHVLGRHGWRSGPFGTDYTCSAVSDVEVQAVLCATLSAIAEEHRGIWQPAEQSAPLREKFDVAQPVAVGTAADEAEFKEGSFFVSDGVLHQIVDALPVVINVKAARGDPGLFAKHAAIIKGLIPIRDTVRAILRAQLNDLPYAALQQSLAAHYRQFTKKHGPINRTVTNIRTDPETGAEREYQRRPNLQPFMDDPDVWLVASIEAYDEQTDTGTPAAIFAVRVVRPPVTQEIHSAQDALAASLHERGRVDLPLIADLLGVSEADAIRELADEIYLDPVRSTPHFDNWVPADEAFQGRCGPSSSWRARRPRPILASLPLQPRSKRYSPSISNRARSPPASAHPGSRPTSSRRLSLRRWRSRPQSATPSRWRAGPSTRRRLSDT